MLFFFLTDEFGCLTQEIFTETYFRVHESVYFNKTPRFPHSSTSEKVPMVQGELVIIFKFQDSLPQKTDRPELTSRVLFVFFFTPLFMALFFFSHPQDSAPSPVTVEGVPIESILSDEGVSTGFFVQIF